MYNSCRDFKSTSVLMFELCFTISDFQARRVVRAVLMAAEDNRDIPHVINCQHVAHQYVGLLKIKGTGTPN